MIWARVSIARGLDPGDLAKSVEPSSVSFSPSASSRDWSVSVISEDVDPVDAPRSRNTDRRFREGGR